MDDQQTCLALSLNACIVGERIAAHFANHNVGLTESVLILPGSRNHNIETITDKQSLEAVELYLRYGAENAPATDHTVRFSRRDLVRGILEQEQVKQMYRQNFGPWNDALLDRYCQELPEDDPT